MKQHLKFVYLVIFTVFSCTKYEEVPPFVTKANFTITHNDWVAPCTPTIVNSSSNAVRYEWDFGDGSTSSLDINPKYIYSLPGNYLVKMKAFDTYGRYDSLTVPISIRTYIYIRHASNYPYSVTVRLNGVSQEINKGETKVISAVTVFDVFIWECIGQNCKWDGAYSVAPNGHYKVIDAGSQWDLKLVSE